MLMYGREAQDMDSQPCHYSEVRGTDARLAKTQVFDQLKVLFAGTNPGSDFRKLIATFHTFISVSYTHLDVYKRQT